MTQSWEYVLQSHDSSILIKVTGRRADELDLHLYVITDSQYVRVCIYICMALSPFEMRTRSINGRRLYMYIAEKLWVNNNENLCLYLHS